MSFAQRIGLAITRPSWAFVVAGDRTQAGRGGQDLLALLALAMIATQLRWLVQAGLFASIDFGLGARAFGVVVTDALTIVLGVLMLGALAIFLWSGGPRKDLGRAFDLACVAIVPMLLWRALLAIYTFAAGIAFAPMINLLAFAILLAIPIAMVVIACQVARRPAREDEDADVPAPIARAGRIAGGLAIAVLGFGLACQCRFLIESYDSLRPLTDGRPAPQFTVAQIDDHGQLGAPISLSQLAGKPVVVDFWATWCGPCLASMPELDRFTRAHPDVTVLAVNIDSAAEARALFRDKGYAMKLVFGDEDIQRAYGVQTIPHTVVIDGAQQVRKVGHAGQLDLDATIAALGH